MTTLLALSTESPVPTADVDAPVTLDRLDRGVAAIVVELRPSSAFGELDETVTRRLKELGFLPGAEIRVVAFGAFRREPIAVRVAEGTFALRREEAAKVIVAITGR